MNIEGKRTGEGFVTHKARLINALSKALSDRVKVCSFTLGRKGLLGYLKAVDGSNIVKVVPSGVSDSESHTNGHKRLKIICGSNTSVLDDSAFIGKDTPNITCEVRVHPHNVIIPNMGNSEIAEALNKVLPFTASDEKRPVLGCVKFIAKDGKLTLVSADGFRIAITNIDYVGEGEALINRDDLEGIAKIIGKAKRVNLSFVKADSEKSLSDIVIDTDSIKYKLSSFSGAFPEYSHLIPSEFKTVVHFDTGEAIKAVNSLKALSDSKEYPIDINFADDKIILSNPNETGQAEVKADVTGNGYVRIQGNFLVQALKAVNGLVDLKVNNSYSPVLFCADDLKVLIMPMISTKAEADKKADQAEAEAKAKAEAEAQGQADNIQNEQPDNQTTEPITDNVTDQPTDQPTDQEQTDNGNTKTKGKGKKHKELVTV